MQYLQTVLAQNITRSALKDVPASVIKVGECRGTGKVSVADGSRCLTGDHRSSSSCIQHLVFADLQPLANRFTELGRVAVTLHQRFALLCGQEGDECALTGRRTVRRVADDESCTVDHVVLESHSASGPIGTLHARHFAL